MVEGPLCTPFGARQRPTGICRAKARRRHAYSPLLHHALCQIDNDYYYADGGDYQNGPCNGPTKGIVLMHAREEYNVGQSNPLDLTKLLVPALRAKGYRFVPLDAIPNLPGTKTSAPVTQWTSHFSNDEGWGTSASLYGTLRFANIGGLPNADVCGRKGDGVYCAVSDGSSFTGWKKWSNGTDFSDTQGWAPEQYSTTIQLGDVNGDGAADLCGRGIQGIWCALSNGLDFRPYTLWSFGVDFADAEAWDSNVAYYGTIRLADVNGDGKADVCGRGIQGIWCAVSDGVAHFGPKTPSRPTTT